MAEAQRPDFNTQSLDPRPDFPPARRTFVLGGVKSARRSEETTALLTLSEAAEAFGVDLKVIYRLVELKMIDPPLQRGGKGRVYYSEAQLRRALTETYFVIAA